MASQVKHRSVRLIAMGGTIAFDSGSDGAVPTLDGHGLGSWLGSDGVAVHVDDLAQISSIGLQDGHLLELAARVRAVQQEASGGVVVTHGTDTLEETAYFLALTCPRGATPIVLTGAMRHNGLPGHDGPANLRAAVIAAATPALGALGPVVVMADEIHAARFVAKTHGTRVAAFASPLAGPIGNVVEDRAEVWFDPAYEDYIGEPTGELPRVELIKMVIGIDDLGLRSIMDSSPAGVVIEGFGGGHVAPALLRLIDDAADRGIPVIVASRSGDGPTLQATYAVPGTEIDLQQRGALMAGALSGLKARLRLAVATACGLPAADVFPVR
jgi:L-asparaginase